MQKREKFWVPIIGWIGLIGSMSGLTLSGHTLPSSPYLYCQQEQLSSPAQKVEQILRLCQSKQYEAAKQLALALVASPDEYELLVKENRIALHRCLALIYSMEGRTDLADEQIRKVQELQRATIVPRSPQPPQPAPPPPLPPPPPPTPEEKVQQVVALCRKKQFLEVERTAQAISESEYQSLSNTDKAILHYCLAQVYSAQGRIEQAEQQIQKVQQIRQAAAASSPVETPSDRVRQVLALTEIANFPEAKAVAEQLLQEEDYATLLPTDKIILHRCLAQIYAAEGDEKSAAQQFRQILAIKPNFALKDPNSPLSDVVSPRIEKIFKSVIPGPSSSVLALGGVGLAALIAGLRSGGEVFGPPDPNQLSLTVSPFDIPANGSDPATIILQVRDSLGRLVTSDSMSLVTLTISNPGGAYQITLENEKGNLVGQKSEGRIPTVEATYRVQEGEARIKVKILAPAGTPSGTRRVFDLQARVWQDKNGNNRFDGDEEEFGERLGSIVSVWPEQTYLEIPLHVATQPGSGNPLPNTAIAVITDISEDVINRDKGTEPELSIALHKPGDQTKLYDTLAQPPPRAIGFRIQWGIQIRYPAGISSVTLFWAKEVLPSSEATPGFSFRLDTDGNLNTTDDRIDMRTSSEFRFDTGGVADGRRQFWLIAERTRSRGRQASPMRPLITGLTAQPSRGGHVVATFSLNRPAQVRAFVRTMNGQTLQMWPARSASRGMNSFVLTGDALRKAPPGTYLLEVEAFTEEGAHTRAAIPIVITR